MNKIARFSGIILFPAVIACVLVAGIRLYVIEPHRVSGNSMNPTLVHNQYLLVNRLSYTFREPKRGELVTFYSPEMPDTLNVKRIIGLPNETVSLSENGVEITQASGDTFVLDEPYTQGHLGSTMSMRLGPDDFFVLGDNRSQSTDSRTWGPMERPYLVGTVISFN